MAATDTRRTEWRAALAAASQWRLLVLWLVGLLLPTLVASLPVWRALGRLLDHSVHAQDWAVRLDALALLDTVAALAPSAPVLQGSAALALLLMVLILPFLNGMVVGSALSGRRLGFGHLLQCGVVEYACMARLLLCSIVVYALAALPVIGAFTLAAGVAERALLEATADRAFAVAVGVLVVCVLLAQVVLESARAAFMADAGLRSATRAIGRGVRVAWRRPLATFGWFLGVSAAGYAVALVLAALRTALPRGHWVEFGIAFVLAELIALALAWMHIARMFTLRGVAQGVPPPAARPAASDAGSAAADGGRA